MTKRSRSSRDWRKQIALWLDACESKLPEPDFLKGEFPDWVQRIARELMSTLLPEAKFRIHPEWSAQELGGIMGHQLAYFHALEELRLVPDHRAFRKLDKKTRARVLRQIKEFADCRAAALERSLALVARQSYADATEFFTAFAKALNRKPADAEASNFHRNTTRIYWLMLVGWRSVERLRSVHQLQQALCRRFEPHVVGDVKRIEKMCQRLGLRFGPPGRPKKKLVD